MTGRLILMTDLDDTLFYSERKLSPGVEAVPAAVNGDGQPISYQCPRQQRLWRALAEVADVVIPVTGRTSYALERVSVLSCDLAVVSHGSLILHEGDVHPSWRTRLTEQIPGTLAQLQQAHADLDLCLSEGDHQHLRFRILEDMGVPVYLSVKAEGGSSLNEKTQRCLAEVAQLNQLTLHLNERNAALRPRYTRKDDACHFVLEHIVMRQPEDTVITFGDSLSDLPFMGAGDVAMTPTQSQIWNSIKELAQ